MAGPGRIAAKSTIERVFVLFIDAAKFTWLSFEAIVIRHIIYNCHQIAKPTFWSFDISALKKDSRLDSSRQYAHSANIFMTIGKIIASALPKSSDASERSRGAPIHTAAA